MSYGMAAYATSMYAGPEATPQTGLSALINMILDPSGSPVAGVSVQAKMVPYAAFRSDTGSEIARIRTATSDANGTWVMQLTDYDLTTPTGTYWLITERIPLAKGGTRQWYARVSATDTSLANALYP